MIKIAVLFNTSKQIVLAENAQLAKNFQQRLRGWINRSGVGSGEALILMPCQAIHTCFLKFPLDALFVAANGQVLLTIASLAPFRFSPFVRSAKMVVELPVGRIKQTNTVPGDRLVLYDKEVPYV